MELLMILLLGFEIFILLGMLSQNLCVNIKVLYMNTTGLPTTFTGKYFSSVVPYTFPLNEKVMIETATILKIPSGYYGILISNVPDVVILNPIVETSNERVKLHFQNLSPIVRTISSETPLVFLRLQKIENVSFERMI